ncbi:hypothetical protein QQ045_019538 [Rhodiola kirilowii]
MEVTSIQSSSGSPGNALESSTSGKQLSSDESEPLSPFGREESCSEDEEPCFEDEEPCSEDDVSFHSTTQLSENGTQYWTLTCPEELKICTGMTFPSHEAAYDFYYRYGVHCRFDIRRGPTHKSSDGTVMKRYIYCNKQGFVLNKSFDNENGKWKKESRNCTSSRCGCKAKLVIKFNGPSEYIVSEFVESHNHSMASLDGAQFLKCRRKMKPQHKRFVFGCSISNVGSSRSYKLSKHLVGGSSNVGAQKTDYRNFHRDVVAFIELDDAQLVLNKLVKKKEMCSSFYYEYSVVKGALSRIFWADSISQLNFHAFGEVVTFDATYSLNRYNLIFVPFTGIDNHKKNVTFAAALLFSEDLESYTWILECFKKCMGHTPQIVLTDQDPALRVVVPKVMPDAHHRYCIWHIMKKLSVTVGFNTPELQQFRKKLKTVVYDYHVETTEFEKNWNDIISEYGLAISAVMFFAILKSACIEKIPKRYVHNRWTRDAIQTISQSLDPILLEHCQIIQQARMIDQDLWMDFNTCLSIADIDNEKREYIHCKLKEMRLHLEQLSIGHRVPSKSDIISELIGASKPIERTVNCPALVHTKGSGKRLRSNFEETVKKRQRAPRMCKSGTEVRWCSKCRLDLNYVVEVSAVWNVIMMSHECSMEPTYAVQVSAVWNLSFMFNLEPRYDIEVSAVWNQAMILDLELQYDVAVSAVWNLSFMFNKCSMELILHVQVSAVWNLSFMFNLEPRYDIEVSAVWNQAMMLE